MNLQEADVCCYPIYFFKKLGTGVNRSVVSSKKCLVSTDGCPCFSAE